VSVNCYQKFNQLYTAVLKVCMYFLSKLYGCTATGAVHVGRRCAHWAPLASGQ